MMMEADVVMGRLYGENDTVAKRPVMGHPPATESDITLTDFLNTIVMVRNLLYRIVCLRMLNDVIIFYYIVDFLLLIIFIGII